MRSATIQKNQFSIRLRHSRYCAARQRIVVRASRNGAEPLIERRRFLNPHVPTGMKTNNAIHSWRVV